MYFYILSEIGFNPEIFPRTNIAGAVMQATIYLTDKFLD